MMCVSIRCCHRSSTWCPISISIESIDSYRSQFHSRHSAGCTVQIYQQALHYYSKKLCNSALKQTHIYSGGQSNYLHFKRHPLCSGQFNCLHPSTIIQYCKVLPQFSLAMLAALIDPRESPISEQKKATR